MLKRLFIPDYMRASLREKQQWFLSNFEVDFLYCSYWDNPAPWFIEKRRVMDNFIIFPGNPIFIGTEQEEKTISRGEFFMVPENNWHWYGLADGEKSTEHIILHILFNSKLYLNPLDIFPSVFHKLENYDQWYERLKKMICLTSFSQNAVEHYAGNLMTELILELIENEEDSIKIPEGNIDQRITRALLYIDERCSEDITVEDMAEYASLKPVRFRALFKAQTGRTPRDYLTGVRIRKASDSLVNTRMKIKEISAKTGFSNEYYFCTAFKKATGMTPSSFRMEERNKKAP